MVVQSDWCPYEKGKSGHSETARPGAHAERPCRLETQGEGSRPRPGREASGEPNYSPPPIANLGPPDCEKIMPLCGILLWRPRSILTAAIGELETPVLPPAWRARVLACGPTPGSQTPAQGPRSLVSSSRQ